VFSADGRAATCEARTGSRARTRPAALRPRPCPPLAFVLRVRVSGIDPARILLFCDAGCIARDRGEIGAWSLSSGSRASTRRRSCRLRSPICRAPSRGSTGVAWPVIDDGAADADNRYETRSVPALSAPVPAGRAPIVVGARPVDGIAHFPPRKRTRQRPGGAAVRR